MRFLKNLVAFYKYLAVLLLNTIVVFLLFNWLSGLYVNHLKREQVFNENKVIAKYTDKFDDAALMEKLYPGMSREDIRTLLDESWNRDFVFRPWVMYGERPIKGAYVTVDEAGFRAVPGQGPWPPEKQYANVFLFGGSTLFGYGLADDQHVGARLQRILDTLPADKPYRVYNFGMGTYYSTQEKLLFMSLLMDGFIPDLAVFLDGFNDPQRVEDAPWNSERFRQMMESRARHTGAWEEIHLNWLKGKIIEYLPVTEQLFKLERLLPHAAVTDAPASSREKAEALAKVQIVRYARNKTMIAAVARAFGVKTLFVWQPASKYNADTLKINPFTTEDGAQLTSLYKEAAERRDKGAFGDDFYWCADILKNETEPLYVDSAHYSGKLSDMCARCIAKGLEEKGLVPAR